MGSAESPSIDFDVGFGTILDHLTLLTDRVRPTLPWTGTDKSGSTRNLRPVSLPLKSCLDWKP
jgi:hypothetical protein